MPAAWDVVFRQLLQGFRDHRVGVVDPQIATTTALW